jgi:hypothetical protein
MIHYNSKRSFAICSLLLAVLLLVACNAPKSAIIPSTSPSFPPTAGTYSGSMEDGSTLQVVLVSTGNQVQVEGVGYRFVPTGIEVKRVSLEGNKGFGEVKANIISFQIPVMMGFFGPIQYYDATLRWVNSSEINCTLTKADPKDESLKLQINNLSIDATNIPVGASMKDNYELILNLKQ